MTEPVGDVGTDRLAEHLDESTQDVMSSAGRTVQPAEDLHHDRCRKFHAEE